MSREDYKILGVEESATDEEITAKYNELKKKYAEDRWLDGEAGNEAARMLGKIDAAYASVMEERRERERNTDGKSAYEEIAELLKSGKIAEAQFKLDEFNERGAEWHYLQAVVFYKKNWSNESKKQLEIAMQMDPDNKKYREAYGKLNAKNDYARQSATAQNGDPYSEGRMNGEPVDSDPQMGGNGCSNCISCCYTYLCVDCLFSLCCGCR
ncbi:MAG: DnaJ domain-containing protein [Clostridia bacterium]|nr:DnaJ domain-containing protein [Clostridia bacterium]